MCGERKMAAFVRLVLVLLICWIQRCSAQESPPTRISFNVTKIHLAPNETSTGTPVTITCQPPVSGFSILYGLNIRRVPLNTPDAPSTVLASAQLGQNDGQARLQSAMQGKGVTATGSVGAENGDTIGLIMSRASCSDEAVYQCFASYPSPDGTTGTSESSKELKVEVSAGQLSLTVSPDKSQWTANETMTLTCSGPVGSVDTTSNPNDPRITWIWQRRAPGYTWETLSTNDPTSDINTGGLSSVSCYKRQTSTLKQRLVVEDSGREYRCYIQRNSQRFEELGAHYTVGSVTVDGTIPETDDSSEPAKANVGAIVGGIFGALIVIAVIIIVIYFLVIRPRRQRKAEEYGDNESEKGEEAVPPYSKDPSVVYSQPHQDKDKSEGIPNRAMDESDGHHSPNDHKLPPDNDDKRHGRRHKDKKQKSSPPEVDPTPEEYNYAKPDRHSRDQRRGRHDDVDEKPASREKPRRHDDDRHDHDNRRGRRHREGDNYDERPARYDDGYGQGRRNRGYEGENRPRGHHSSSEDGGTDSYVNTSQHSMGDGDPTIGTAI